MAAKLLYNDADLLLANKHRAEHQRPDNEGTQ